MLRQINKEVGGDGAANFFNAHSRSNTAAERWCFCGGSGGGAAGATGADGVKS